VTVMNTHDSGYGSLRQALADICAGGTIDFDSSLHGQTITLTSLGDRGCETVYGVIYPPQVALVGLGRITEQPWAENGTLSCRKVMVATIAGDHRATDGHTGGLFLEALNQNFQEVDKL